MIDIYIPQIVEASKHLEKGGKEKIQKLHYNLYKKVHIHQQI